MSSGGEKKRADAEGRADLVYRTWLELLAGTKYYKKYMDIQAECERRCLKYGIDAGNKWYREEIDRVFTQEVYDELRRLKGF